MLEEVKKCIKEEFSNYDLDNMSTYELSHAIFDIVNEIVNNKPKTGDTVIFLDIDGSLRYRNKVKVDGFTVYNEYNWSLHSSEVSVYTGNPEELKSLIANLYLKGASSTLGYEIEYKAEFKIKEKEVKTMSTLNKMIEMNKESALNTSKIELGKSANKLIISKVAPQLPMMVRGYADSPLAELVVGNLIAGLLIQFAGDNPKAKILSEAMIAAGTQVAIESFNIPELLNELLSNVAIPSVQVED